MTSYYDENFLCNSYSDELTAVDPEEVNRLMVEDDGWQGYCQWASQLEQTEQVAAIEQYAFERKQERIGKIQLNGVPALIKKVCEHPQCSYFKCERSLRIGGIEI